jgi:hypothetical protein
VGAPNAGAGELAAGLVADGGEAGVAQVRPVRRHDGVGAGVREAARAHARGPLHPQRVAGLERRAQHVDAVAEPLVGEREHRRAVERDRARGHRRVRGDVDGVDGHARAVHQPVAAAQRRRAAPGLELGAQAHAVELRLGGPRVARVAALVVRAERVALRRRAVVVEDVGVVERERAQREHERRRAGRGAGRARREAAARRPEARARVVLAPAHPEEGGADQQQRRPRGPVELEHEPRPHGPAEAVHVRVRPARVAGEDEQRVPDARRPGRAEGERVDAEHGEVRDVLVGDGHVQGDGDPDEQQEVGEVHAEEEAQVQPRLERAVAHAQLHGHRGGHHDDLQGHDGEREAAGAPEQVHPVGHRRGAGDLAQAGLAVAPHQLARVVGDEQHRHQRRPHPRVADGRRHVGGRGHQRVAEERHQRGAGGDHDPEEGEHHEPAAAPHDHPPRLARDGGDLPRVRARAEGAGTVPRGGRRLGRARRRRFRGRQPRLGARASAGGRVVREPEAVVRQGDHAPRDRQPERAVPQPARREPGDAGPLGVRGPPLAHLLERGDPERVEQPGERPVAERPGEQQRAQERRDGEHGHRRPRGHGAPGGRRRGERERRRHDGVRQRDAGPGGEVRAGPQGPEHAGGGAGAEQAEQDPERHRGGRERGEHERREEAAAEVRRLPHGGRVLERRHARHHVAGRRLPRAHRGGQEREGAAEAGDHRQHEGRVHRRAAAGGARDLLGRGQVDHRRQREHEQPRGGAPRLVPQLVADGLAELRRRHVATARAGAGASPAPCPASVQK